MLALVLAALAEPVEVLNSSGGNIAGDGLRVTVEPDGRIQIWREGAGQIYYGASPSIATTLSVGAVTYWQGGGSPAVDVLVGEAVVGTVESVPVYCSIPGVAEWTIWYDYQAPNEYVDVTVDLEPAVAILAPVTFAHFFDTYLAGGDNGPAYYDPAGAVGVVKAGLYETFLAVDLPWSWFYSGPYHRPWQLVQNGGRLDGTLDFNEWTDNGIGVQWDLGVPDGPLSWQYRIAFTTDVTVLVPPVETSTGTGTATDTGTSPGTTTSTSTQTATATSTDTPTVTDTATATATSTSTPTATATATATETDTATATSTATATLTETDTATGTGTHTCPDCICEPETVTVTVTSVETATVYVTETVTQTVVLTETVTQTNTVYVTETVTLTDVRTDTRTVYVDAEDPELWRGGWSCAATPGRAGVWVVLAAVLALVRRAVTG
jgi:hypothetical protein